MNMIQVMADELADMREEIKRLKAELKTAVEAEREACARVCDKVKTECEEGGVRFTTARTCAKRIRARGEK